MKNLKNKLIAGILAMALIAMPVTAMAGEASHFAFTNVGASLIVDKERTDGITSSDETFTLVLTDSSGNAVSGAVYYLFDKDGNPIDDTGYTTQADGSFTLNAGQQAWIWGLSDGATYTVSETLTGDQNGKYKNLDAQSATISEDVSTLTFTNEQLSTITINKMISNDNNAPLEGAEFTIYKGDAVVETLTTGADGKLTFKSLPEGTYTIKETQVPNGYIAVSDDITVTLPVTVSGSEIGDSGLDPDDGLYNSETNTYYFYDTSYDVYNIVNTGMLPNASGWVWPTTLAVVIGCAAIAIASLMAYRQRSRQNGRK